MKSKINLKNYFCGVPFNSLEIHNNVCFVCCPSWLPNKVELSEYPLKNIYNSKNINFIDYDWCSRVVEILNIVD